MSLAGVRVTSKKILSSESAELVQRGKRGGREESKEGRELSPATWFSALPEERAPRADRVEQELQGGLGPLGRMTWGVLQTQPSKISSSARLRGNDGRGVFGCLCC